MRVVLMAFAIVAALAGVARADSTVQALGTAPVGDSGDTQKAHDKALDDGVRQAVGQAVAALVDPKEREAKADLIKKRILRGAKLYVVSYKILDEGQEDAVYHVEIEATIADAKLAADLHAAKIALVSDATNATQPDGGDGGDGDTHPVRHVRPKIAVLVITEAGATDDAALGKSVAEAIGAQGFDTTVLAAAHGPVEDADAVKRARSAGAAVVVIAAIGAHDGGKIRGTRQLGAEGEAALRVVDDTGASAQRVIDAKFTGAGFGADAQAANAAAMIMVAHVAVTDVARSLAQLWPQAADAAAAGVLVEITNVTRWQDVAAAQKALAATPGVDRVVARGFGKHDVTLIVVGKTVQPQTLVGALSSAGLPAAAAGQGVRVDLAPAQTVPTAETRP